MKNQISVRGLLSLPMALETANEPPDLPSMRDVGRLTEAGAHNRSQLTELFLYGVVVPTETLFGLSWGVVAFVAETGRSRRRERPSVSSL